MVDDFCRYSWWMLEIFGTPSYEFYLAGAFFELHQDDPNQDSNQQLTTRWSSVDVQIHKIHWNAMGCTILTTEFKYERPPKKMSAGFLQEKSHLLWGVCHHNKKTGGEKQRKTCQNAVKFDGQRSGSETLPHPSGSQRKTVDSRFHKCTDA